MYEQILSNFFKDEPPQRIAGRAVALFLAWLVVGSALAFGADTLGIINGTIADLLNNDNPGFVLTTTTASVALGLTILILTYVLHWLRGFLVWLWSGKVFCWIYRFRLSLYWSIRSFHKAQILWPWSEKISKRICRLRQIKTHSQDGLLKSVIGQYSKNIFGLPAIKMLDDLSRMFGTTPEGRTSIENLDFLRKRRHEKETAQQRAQRDSHDLQREAERLLSHLRRLGAQIKSPLTHQQPNKSDSKNTADSLPIDRLILRWEAADECSKSFKRLQTMIEDPSTTAATLKKFIDFLCEPRAKNATEIPGRSAPETAPKISNFLHEIDKIRNEVRRSVVDNPFAPGSRRRLGYCTRGTRLGKILESTSIGSGIDFSDEHPTDYYADARDDAQSTYRESAPFLIPTDYLKQNVSWREVVYRHVVAATLAVILAFIFGFLGPILYIPQLELVRWIWPFLSAVFLVRAYVHYRHGCTSALNLAALESYLWQIAAAPDSTRRRLLMTRPRSPRIAEYRSLLPIPFLAGLSLGIIGNLAERYFAPQNASNWRLYQVLQTKSDTVLGPGFQFTKENVDNVTEWRRTFLASPPPIRSMDALIGSHLPSGCTGGQDILEQKAYHYSTISPPPFFKREPAWNLIPRWQRCVPVIGWVTPHKDDGPARGKIASSEKTQFSALLERNIWLPSPASNSMSFWFDVNCPQVSNTETPSNPNRDCATGDMLNEELNATLHSSLHQVIDFAREQIKRADEQGKQARFVIVGHADVPGATEFNKDLSAERAKYLRTSLQDAFGSAPNGRLPYRISEIAAGGDFPWIRQDSEIESQPLNRRADVFVFLETSN